MDKTNRVCIQCGEIEEDCRCNGGFKILYVMGEPKSQSELDEMVTYDQAKKNVITEAENIKRILGR